MLKYYRTGIPKFTVYYFIVMFASTVIMPLVSIFGKLEEHHQYMISTGIFFNYFICTLAVVIFTPTGASPSNRRSLESVYKARNMSGGSSGYYDMTCILPVKRKDYAKYSLYIIWADAAVHSLIIILAVFSDSIHPQISSFLSVAYLMIMLSYPAMLVNMKKPFTIAATVLVITACLMTVAFFIIGVTGNTDIMPVIPAGARIGIVIFTSVYLIVSGYLCVFRGEYARNGERIRN